MYYVTRLGRYKPYFTNNVIITIILIIFKLITYLYKPVKYI